MKSWKTPTPEQVDRAVALIGRAEQGRYFFDRLENPCWIAPLRERGFFSRPPRPQHDENRGTVGFMPWPESRYLVRMAKIPEAHSLVLDIALAVETDNIRVIDDLVEIATTLPPALAARLVPKAKGWIKSRYSLLRTENLGRLVSHLARGGESSAAMRLARCLLAVRPERGGADKRGSGAQQRYRPRPVGYLSEWAYRQVLQKDIPALIQYEGTKALEMLCDLLHSALRIAGRGDKHEDTEDFSYIWRPAIESHEQNLEGRIEESLVSAVRDASQQLITENEENVTKVISMLETRRSQVFKRIALYLLRVFPAAPPELAEERLVNRAIFDNVGLRHEYALLIHDRFGVLPPDRQETILGWIAEGPDTDLKAGRRDGDADADPEQYKRQWQLNRLTPIAEHLPAAWSDTYQALVAEFGKPEHPEFPVFRRLGWGPETPKTEPELASMKTAELAVFLREWEPANSWPAPTPEGLSRVLERVVAASPEEYSTEAAHFQDVDPTYVRSVISGFWLAAKEDKRFEWQSVLQLCRWVLEQPREIPGRKVRGFDTDPHWGWARKAIADLLYVGFGDKENALPLEQRKASWELINKLLDDPEPTPSDEERSADSTFDPASLAINSVRGSAMHAVIRYGLWIRRHLDMEDARGKRSSRSLEDMPEVRRALENHLELDRDPSLAVRSVYGQWFPWIVLLDGAWARNRVDHIFPSQEGALQYWRAAWDTYVRFCPVYSEVYPILREKYAWAADHVTSGRPESGSPTDADQRFAEHLMELYWRGLLDSPRETLLRFQANASDALRAYAIGYVGRSLETTKDDPPKETMERIYRLWEEFVAVTDGRQGDHLLELAAFGWWFSSGKLESTWAFEQLHKVLALTGRIEPDHMVLDQLASWASTHPVETCKCLDDLLAGQLDTTTLFTGGDAIRTVLRSALESGNSQTQELAIRLIDKLGTLGYLEYRDLLPRG